MYLVAIAWLYVVLMMAAAEALSSQGTLLGAFFTLLLYGLLPLGVVLYIMGTPLRRRARQAETPTAEADPGPAAGPGLALPSVLPGALPGAQPGAQPGALRPLLPPDAGHMPTSDTVASKGKEA